MQPSRLSQPLTITKGATFRQSFFLQQPVVEYRPVTGSLATAPIRLKVPGHGLISGQPIWVEDLREFPELNSPYGGSPVFADVVDADTIRFDQVSGVGRPRVQSGQIVYQLPMDLTGCTARFEIVTPTGEPLADLTGSVDPIIGQIMVQMPSTDTAAVEWARAKFRLWVTMSNGDVDPWLVGDLVSREAW